MSEVTVDKIFAKLADVNSGMDTMETDYSECLDAIWMLLAMPLVFFMHAGLGLLEAGSVRFKNTQNILTKNLLVVSIGFLTWYAFGYALGFGLAEEPNRFSGGKHFLMIDLWGDKSRLRVWLFQGTFCATGGTIVSGAMAERTKLMGFGVYTTLMTAFIYPLVVYWAWSTSGFLNYTDETGKRVSVFGPPFIDFAGSGVVHLVGGVGALCGAIVVGPRKNRWDPAYADAFYGHSVPFCVLGVFFLWCGWYGFNPGNVGQLHSREDAYAVGLVAVNTTLAPCVSGLLVFFLRARVVEPKRLDVGGFCNGILAGLVSVSAGCATIKPWETVIIGLLAGAIYQGASMLLKRFQVDDVVDAFAVHGASGLWAVLAAGLFGNPDEGVGGNGLLYGGDQLWTQLIAALIIASWAGVLSLAILVPLKRRGLLRLSDDFQEHGADVMEHTPEKAYNDSQKIGIEDTINQTL